MVYIGLPMVYRVVSTKLTEEEHTRLLDICNKQGCTPSALIKDAIIKKISEKENPGGIEPAFLEKFSHRRL